MAHRIEIVQIIPDTRAQVRKKDLDSIGFSKKVDDVKIVDVYTIEGDLPKPDLERVKGMLANSVFQEGSVDDPVKTQFDYAIEIGFLPGVTDNVGNTAREAVSDQHQNRLKEIGDWVIFPRTLEYLADGRYSQDEQCNLYFDDKPIPQGLSLEMG